MIRSILGGILLVIIASVATGCASDHGPYGKLTLIYATDRESSPNPGEYFGGGRTGISFGSCTIGVKTDGRPTPTGFALHRPHTDPADRSGILQPPEPFGCPKAMGAAIRDAIAVAPQKEFLIWVHGFNVPYKDACLAAAQLAYDDGFEGVPLVFDWPSEGRLFGYLTDEESAEWVAPHLATFIHWLHVNAPGAKIQIVSHSMGSRVVTLALRDLMYDHLSDLDAIAHVVFVAADIDVDIFRDTAMPELHGHGIYTVYGSGADSVLRFSKWLHAHKREGERPDEDTIDTKHKRDQWFECVDATRVDTSDLGHSYYDGGVAQVMLDIQALLRDDDCNRTAKWNCYHTFRTLTLAATQPAVK